MEKNNKLPDIKDNNDSLKKIEECLDRLLNNIDKLIKII
jgi:hypothetical protein